MLNLIKRSVNALAAMPVAGRFIPSYWHRLYVCCVVLMAMLTYAPAAHAWSGSPSSLGCNGAGFCHVPSSSPGYTLTLKDGDWVPLVLLGSTGAAEGVWVTVINQATNSTRVAWFGQDDGLPLTKGQELTFFYRKDRSGTPRWEAVPRPYSYYNRNPLPSFNGGVVQLDVDPQDNPGMPKELTLPANPIDGSVYRLYLDHSSPQSVVVKAGSASYTLSASVKEAYFVAQNGVWRITLSASPNSLGCKDGAASCQVPSDALGYTFTLKDKDWVSMVRLPASPRAGDWVKVINQANNSTRVAVDGNNNDGLPLTKGQELSFNYRKDHSGTLRWEALSRKYQEVNKNPLPSFNRGVVQLNVEPYDNPGMPNPLILPANPADGSVYRLYLSEWYISPSRFVEVNAGGGSSYTLSENMKEGYFVARNGVWILTSGYPTQLGCNHGASCQLPSGKAVYTFILTHTDWVSLVKLPTSPREGDSVHVINNASTTRVAVDGSNGDGMPLNNRASQTYTYQVSPEGVLQWVIGYQHIENLPGSSTSPFSLPSFQRGRVYLDVSQRSPARVILPANPQDGSVYAFGMNFDATNSVVVQLAPTAGADDVTLSASHRNVVFVASGGKWLADATQLPSGQTTYTVTDANWTSVIKLPTSPKEGDSVRVTNNASSTTRVAVDGSNGDGMPLNNGASQTYTYQVSPEGVLQWVIGYQHIENLPGSSTSPFSLPSFQRGRVYLDVSQRSPARVILPANPQDGSVYAFGMNSNVPNSVVVQLAQTAGAGDITLSASRTGAVFVASGRQWYEHGTVTLLPSGQTTYTVTDANWTPVIKLPTSPKEGDSVRVTNNASSTTRVAVDGSNGDGMPLNNRASQTYTYQVSPEGVLQWVIGYQHIENLPGSSTSPFSLPSFQRGRVYLDVSQRSPARVILPANPQDGSVYAFGMNSNVPNSVVVQLAQTAGAGDITLSAAHLSATFVASGGKWVADVTPLLSGQASYTVTDANWAPVIKLPTSPKEGDKVKVDNKATWTTKVAVDGINGDGLPFKKDRTLEFVYQKSPSGALQWIAGAVHYNFYGQNPLPSFNRGAAQVDVDPQDNSGMPNPLSLPASPADGSSYRLYLNHSSPQAVTINTGSGNVALSASRKAAVFVASGGQWRDESTVVQVPSGQATYTVTD
ncbi:hypothetical protein, partial [Aeromonas jandaei]|uniref:hypothetical protein n=1 Tax=Aeromonas jandaei TaxID=650 RepID=UPI001ABF2368